MSKEIRAALVAAFGLALTLLFAVIAFRVVTPSILEAHFQGSTLVAVLVGLCLAAALIAFTGYWVSLVGRLLRNIETTSE